MLFLMCGLFLSIIIALVVDTLNHLASFNFVILTAVYSSCDKWAIWFFMNSPKAILEKKNL